MTGKITLCRKVPLNSVNKTPRTVEREIEFNLKIKSGGNVTFFPSTKFSRLTIL